MRSPNPDINGVSPAKIQVLNADGIANIHVRLLIVKELGSSDATKAAKDDILAMLRPEAPVVASETQPVDDEETDPRRD